MPKLKRYTNWRRNELEPIDEPSSPKKDVLSVGKDIMLYPNVRVNWTVEVNRPDPDMLEVLLPQSQKLLKEVSSTKRIRKFTKEMRQDNRKINQVYRNKTTTGFNLLKKCVPGTEKLNRPEILMSVVNYIRELKNKVRELENCIEKRKNYTTPLPMESTQLFSTPTDCDSVPSTGMKRDSGPTITLHYYSVPSTGTEQESDSTMDCTDIQNVLR
jgi:hypothetical protein